MFNKWSLTWRQRREGAPQISIYCIRRVLAYRRYERTECSRDLTLIQQVLRKPQRIMMHKGLCAELSVLGECTVVIEVVCVQTYMETPKEDPG